MREFTRQYPDNEIKSEIKVDQKKEIRLIDSERKIRGHILWEYNPGTHKLTRAKFAKQDVKISHLSASLESIKFVNKVLVNDGCEYLQALNRKNALKHLKNKGIQIEKII